MSHLIARYAFTSTGECEFLATVRFRESVKYRPGSIRAHLNTHRAFLRLEGTNTDVGLEGIVVNRISCMSRG